ncbi:MAG: hypothetical protein FWD88_03485 [Treponema sp.]|nr:hypothetical protein [Treponema sp.]
MKLSRIGAALLVMGMVALFAGCPQENGTPVLVGNIAIEGTARVGELLTAVGDLTAHPDIRLQWQRGVVDIVGATNTTYLLQPADANHTIRVVATRPGYSGSIASSNTATVSGLTGPSAEVQVYFTNYQGTAAAFRVRSGVNQPLVAFRNSVSAANLLGGIPAGAQNHGIRDNQTLLVQAADAFPVVLITEAQLNAASTWAELEANHFSRIFVFYNRNAEPGSPAEVYEISGHLGGNYPLTILNPTRHNWEIRLGGQAGPTLGYATAGMQQVTLQMDGGQHLFFPVIRSFNPIQGRLNTVYPRNGAGQPWFTGQLIDNPNGHTFNLNLAMQQVDLNGLTLGVAWLVVHNDHDHSAVQMRRGGSFFQNQVGISFINAGQQRTFHVDMLRVGTDIFSEHVYVNNIVVGIGGVEVPLTTPDGDRNIRLYRDHMFVVNVTGDHSVAPAPTGTMRAVIDVDNARRLTLADF